MMERRPRNDRFRAIDRGPAATEPGQQRKPEPTHYPPAPIVDATITALHRSAAPSTHAATTSGRV